MADSDIFKAQTWSCHCIALKSFNGRPLFRIMTNILYTAIMSYTIWSLMTSPPSSYIIPPTPWSFQFHKNILHMLFPLLGMLFLPFFFKPIYLSALSSHHFPSVFLFLTSWCHILSLTVLISDLKDMFVCIVIWLTYVSHKQRKGRAHVFFAYHLPFLTPVSSPAHSRMP